MSKFWTFADVAEKKTNEEMAETQQPPTIEELVEELLDCARYGEEEEVQAILKEHPEIGNKPPFRFELRDGPTSSCSDLIKPSFYSS